MTPTTPADKVQVEYFLDLILRKDEYRVKLENALYESEQKRYKLLRTINTMKKAYIILALLLIVLLNSCAGYRHVRSSANADGGYRAGNFTR